jgi:hypothetical protein
MEPRLETIAVSLFIVVIILALLRGADARDVGQWEHQPANELCAKVGDGVKG